MSEPLHKVRTTFMHFRPGDIVWTCRVVEIAPVQVRVESVTLSITHRGTEVHYVLGQAAPGPDRRRLTENYYPIVFATQAEAIAFSKERLTQLRRRWN